MQQDIDDSIIKNFDPTQLYLWEWAPSIGKSGGILVGINIEFLDVGSFGKADYILQMNLWDKQKREKWNLLIVYGTAQVADKDDFLSELALFCSKSKEPCILSGDFNIIGFSHEKNKAGGVTKHSATFNSIISAFELREVNMTGGKYTWSNNQPDPTLEKLDSVNE